MPALQNRDRALSWLLRGLGLIDACALIVALLPGDFILRISREMGLATLPDSPLDGYLIRSTSVLYALHGGLMLGLASDVARYRPVIRLLGCLAIAHGIVMFGVDRAIGMPAWWTWTEGPVFALCGVVVLALSRDPSNSMDAGAAS